MLKPCIMVFKSNFHMNLISKVYDPSSTEFDTDSESLLILYIIKNEKVVVVLNIQTYS